MTADADHADRHPVLCAHADDDGHGAHWLRPGEKCVAGLASRDMDAETERDRGTRMSKTRQADGSRLATSLTATSDAVEGAEEAAAGTEFAWGVWADSVRQDVEHRHGVSYEPDDPVILEDPEYGRVLDIGGAISEIKGELGALSERWARIEREMEPLLIPHQRTSELVPEKEAGQ